MSALRHALFFVLFAHAGVAASERPQVVEISTRSEGGGLVLSFGLEHVFNGSVRERIDSGIPVVFKHRVQVVAPRRLWLDRIVARAQLETRVRYDSLTRRYELSRTVRPGLRATALAGLEHHRSTDSFDEAREFMTRIDGIPRLDIEAFEGQSLKVEIETVLGRRWYLLLPTRRSVTTSFAYPR